MPIRPPMGGLPVECGLEGEGRTLYLAHSVELSRTATVFLSAFRNGQSENPYVNVVLVT